VDGCQGCGGVSSLSLCTSIDWGSSVQIKVLVFSIHEKSICRRRRFTASGEVNIITTGIATIRDCYYQSYLASGGTMWLSSSLRNVVVKHHILGTFYRSSNDSSQCAKYPAIRGTAMNCGGIPIALLLVLHALDEVWNVFNNKSSEEGDSEFKAKLECVKKAFPTKSDSWRIVTQDDVERQPSPTRTIKLFSIASSGPVQTAPQDNKPVSKLKQSLGNRPEKTSPFIERRHGCKVLFSVEEEIETVSRHSVSTETIFIKERYNNNRITKTLMNPSEILKLFTQTHTSEVNRIGQDHKLSTLGLETTIRFTGDGEYLGDTPKVEMGGEEMGTSNGGDGCSPEQAVETQEIFSETQRRLPNRYTFEMNKVVADRGALKLNRHRDSSPESLVNGGIPTTQDFKMPETMDEGRDCDGRRSGIRNGGAVGSPPESHGSGDADTKTETQISSSHGKRQSRLRFVA
ncbi:hypothetical protein HID58_082537, partial [Brassica napus]